MMVCIPAEGSLTACKAFWTEVWAEQHKDSAHRTCVHRQLFFISLHSDFTSQDSGFWNLISAKIFPRCAVPGPSAWEPCSRVKKACSLAGKTDALMDPHTSSPRLLSLLIIMILIFFFLLLLLFLIISSSSRRRRSSSSSSSRRGHRTPRSAPPKPRAGKAPCAPGRPRSPSSRSLPGPLVSAPSLCVCVPAPRPPQ